MSDSEDNIFADTDDDGNESDDTAELLAQSAAKAPAAKKKKTQAPPKKKPPKDEGDDLFDSDSDDDDDREPAVTEKKPMSKREKLEALAKKKRHEESPSAERKPRKKKEKDSKSSGNDGEEQGDGYESEDSVDSAQIERTVDDDNFIDTTGEDADAIKELYAKQHFDPEEEDMEDNDGKKKKRKYRHGDDEAIEDGKEPDNPLEAAMMRLKRKKREKKSTLELEDEVKMFLERMDAAAEKDEQAVAQRKPGLNKIGMLNEVIEMIKNHDYQSYLIEGDMLSVVRRWIQPLANGQLGNVTVRQKLLEAIAKMPGIHPNALKRSELGKTVMLLHKHPKETPAMKRQTRELIEQWSRGIFQKSGDMRDLEHAGRAEGSLAAIRRQQGAAAAANSAARRGVGKAGGDLKSMIASGKRGGDAMSASVNRVRVPFSKGFAYSVRPTAKGGAEMAADARRSPAKESRSGLSKRMLDKAKKVSKNQRSANISVEGRRTKG